MAASSINRSVSCSKQPVIRGPALVLSFFIFVILTKVSWTRLSILAPVAKPSNGPLKHWNKIYAKARHFRRRPWPRSSPADKRRCPGETAAHRFDHHQVALLDSAVVARDRKGERNRRGRCVGVQIDGNDDFVWRDPKFFRRRVDYAAVGLVRHKPIETGGARCGRLEGRSK